MSLTAQKIDDMIDMYLAAIEAVVAGPGRSYSIDTGQGKQTVTSEDLEMLEKGLALWEDRKRTFNGDAPDIISFLVG